MLYPTGIHLSNLCGFAHRPLLLRWVDADIAPLTDDLRFGESKLSQWHVIIYVLVICIHYFTSRFGESKLSQWYEVKHRGWTRQKVRTCPLNVYSSCDSLADLAA